MTREPVSTSTEATYTDGPNTHKYRDAHFITDWTPVSLTDPEGVEHHFHVPTRIADLLRAEARQQAEARVAGLAHAAEMVATGLEADRPALYEPTADTDREWHKYAARYLRDAIHDATPAASHEPGDSHAYRITCTVCGERGTIQLSVEPQRLTDPATSTPPEPQPEDDRPSEERT